MRSENILMLTHYLIFVPQFYTHRILIRDSNVYYLFTIYFNPITQKTFYNTLRWVEITRGCFYRVNQSDLFLGLNYNSKLTSGP